jgi:enoyl-CoA hydratase/carnithine racemase
MADHDAVTTELDGRIAIVRLNRPAAMNAVNDAVRQGLTRALKQLDAGDHADAIVLTGSGERAFCAGQDLEESAAITTDRSPAG